MSVERVDVDLTAIGKQLTVEQLQQLLKEKQDPKLKNRTAYKELVDETLDSSIASLIDISEKLSAAKAKVFADFEAVIALKKEAYSVNETQKSHRFSKSGRYGLIVGYRENDAWDDTVTAGIEKITHFMRSLSKDEKTGAAIEMGFKLLKKTRNGGMKASAVLELEKLREVFNSTEFDDGVKILRKAYKPVPSCWFIDAWTIDKEGKERGIPLSISAARFPEGFEFKGF